MPAKRISEMVSVALLTALAAVVGCNQMGKQVESLAPPAGAVVLFDGTDFAHWKSEHGGPVQWELVDGAMKVVPGKDDIITNQTFGDIQLHVEFNIPKETAGNKGQSRGNSGIYIQRRYEVQILDSYGQELKNDGCGAIYKTKPPDKNVCKKPGEWQSYDITFHAARFEGEGQNIKKVKNARITVIHNGTVIHNDFEIPNKTGNGRPEGPEPGPIALQDHESPVKFRNIWVVPLDQTKCSNTEGRVNIITLNPGHFHAALVQKAMYQQVGPTIHVYAPKGPDVENHLRMIEGFNSRADNPTCWKEIVYTGDDFLEKMLKEKPGNMVVIAGNNKKKTEYIKACVDAGLNVLADKPMCINAEGFNLLEKAFASAEKNNVLLYDIMTERYEITTILQKELISRKDVFGRLQTGTIDEPAVVKESTHHFFKYVAGSPLRRPAWYFDTAQQGEGIVDVTTHLVDMVMWTCFPQQPIDYKKDIDIKEARRWPTMITQQQFEQVTGLADFPDFLKEKLNSEGALPCYANGEMVYTLKDIYVKLTAKWNYRAPEGASDTHFSVIKGSKANIIIRQGKDQNYRPELYVEPVTGTDTAELAQALQKAVAELQASYPGLELKRKADVWHILIPDKYRIGHEAHFREVTEKYLNCLQEAKLPDWEVPNMKAKYYTTTRALELASRQM